MSILSKNKNYSQAPAINVTETKTVKKKKGSQACTILWNLFVTCYIIMLLWRFIYKVSMLSFWFFTFPLTESDCAKYSTKE